MKILVFGKDGQLGKAFQDQLRKPSFQKQNSSYFVGRAECDLGDVNQIANLLGSFNPDLIINAAAYTKVDKAEIEQQLAFAVNSIAPAVMAKYAAKHNAALLHFSTDYVFDGVKQDTYTELDITNPLCVYGKSKEAGERAIIQAFAQSTVGRYVIFRTSWVYGNGNNFIRTILRLAKERSALKVIEDQFGVPTSASWLAELACTLAIDNDQPRKFSSGIYHAVPKGETNWYGLACLAVETALNDGRKLQASKASIAPIPASEYPLPAPRPMNSRLSRHKLQVELEHLNLVSKLPHWNTPWDEQVVAYVKQLFLS